MRGLAERWRRRGLRPPMPSGRQTLPLALAGIAVIAAASTTASAARVTTPPGEAPLPVTIGQAQQPLVPPPFLPPAGSTTAPGARTTTPGGIPGQPGGGGTSGESADEFAANGIPVVALEAYQAAERTMADQAPSCGVQWSLLAAIGRVESNHGRFAGSTLLRDGRSDPPIVGIPLDGRPGVARIGDTDGGRYDGDSTYDRAVGPMQFIPGTWAMFAVDGDSDGKSDPFDIDDVALAAARYLCQAGGNLRTDAGLRDAVYSYNRSEEYVRLVLALAKEYARGARVDTLPAPDRNPQPLPPVKKPTLPPGTVGRPPAATPSPTPKPTTPGPTTPCAHDTRAHDDGSEHDAEHDAEHHATDDATDDAAAYVHAGADADGDADRVAHGHADRDADDSVADSHGDPDGHRDAHANADRVADAAALPDAVAVRADRAAGDAPHQPESARRGTGINR